jgi:hypothetical protein
LKLLGVDGCVDAEVRYRRMQHAGINVETRQKE